MGMKSWKNYCKASKRVSKNTPRKYKQKPKKKEKQFTNNKLMQLQSNTTHRCGSQSVRQTDRHTDSNNFVNVSGVLQ